MKKGLLFVSILTSAVTFGQSLTQANEPIIGESQTMFVCDSFANTYENITGSGVTWDYSTIEGYQGQTRTLEIIDPSTSSFSASFPSSTKGIQVENALTTFFTSSATERVSQGFVFSEPSFGDVIAQFDTDEETIVTYPFALGSSLTDTYAGQLDFTFNGVQQNPAATGSAYAWIDGQGSLVLPNGTTTADVIRYKMIDTSLTNVFLFGDLEIIRTQYEYYDIANNNLPLMTFTNIRIQQPGGGQVLTEASIVLSSVEASVFASIDDVQEIDFSIFPTPASDLISVTGDFSNDAIATILDQSGRIIRTESISKLTVLDISNFQNGVYLMKITDKGITSTKRFVKH